MVFEEQVAYYLDRYLGKFVKGLSKETLKISVWAGNVELTNMQLKPEALNALKLPVKVKAGFLGSVKLKVPWSRLGQEPVIVSLDRIFLLAEPATNVDGGDAGDAVQEAKMNLVMEAERKLVEARGDAKMKQETNNSWLGSLVTTIIGNLRLSISNIHIRYEDAESHPGHPFSAGLMLEKLAAVTVDENGKETFVTGGSLDRIQKSSELQRLSVYFDPDTQPWEVPKKWEELQPNEWSQIFVPGIKAESVSGDKSENLGNPAHSFVLQPVGGHARYYKLASKDQRSPESPAQRAKILLDDVTIGLSEGQYRDALKLVENFSTFNKRLQYAHYRPIVSIKEDKVAWWQYAMKAVAEQQKRASGHVSWSRVVWLSEMRKTYLPLYVSSLQSGSPDRISVDDNQEIKDMDRELDTDVIIQWRMMAHTYVDKNRAEDEKRQQQKQGWWPFGWGGQATEGDKEAKFTEGDWEELNRLIGYDETQKSAVIPGQDPPNMLNILLEVHMRHNATKLVGNDKEELLDVSSDDLHIVLHMYPKTIIFDLKLDSYQVACPDGLLAESATKTEAVNATFTYLPSELDGDAKKGNGQGLDWSLAAKASPIYATVLMKSVNKIVKFFQSSKAVSRSVALDTATALQTTFDEVTRNAQQQINHALKDRPRFSIDLDLAAPKITIPSDFSPDGTHQCNLLLDLGYFSLQTEPDDNTSGSAEENELYMRFRLRLTDVSATLVDGEHDWKDGDKIPGNFADGNRDKKGPTYLSVLDKCAILVAFQQICVPHPRYPATRVALRLPSLGFHFSPARYHRLMQISKIFQNSADDGSEEEVHPWEPSDFEGNVSVLAWKGVGHREAVWQRRHAVLTGPFLYLLETPNAQTYKYYSSLIGKQVSEVPPDSVGNIPFVLAVCDAGQFNNKVAVSVNALLLRFDDNTSMQSWQGRLAAAIYRAAATTAAASFMDKESHDSDTSDSSSEATERQEQESVFLIGVLDELKIIISDSRLEDHTSMQILLEPEIPLLEFRAIGTRVELAVRTYEMSVGAVLQALEIEDKYYGHVSPSCRYLARSYIKTSAKPGNPRSNGKLGRRESLNGKLGRRESLNQAKFATNPSRQAIKGPRRSDSDRFFDAEEDLRLEDSPKGHHKSSSSISKFFDAEEGVTEDLPNFAEANGLLPSRSGKDQPVAQDDAQFVKVQVVVYSQDSPDYAHIDKKVTVTLATLSFFSNRRTLLALMDLAAAIGADVGPAENPSPQATSTEMDAMVSTINPKAIDDEDHDNESNASFSRNESVVKGLLGKGKSRIVFLVVLDMDRAQIVLNTEDGAELSVLTLADLNTEVKVFPSSFGIRAALGNLRISDGSLDNDHPYHYICDMRDPKGASFIELNFTSFNKEDDDYEGFEYSIMGKLSELRVVFLNRFVQEIIGYVMGLVPQTSGYVVKLKDRFNDEVLINQSEIEGQPAMKLALSLDKPVIIMPRSTTSADFLELDILHINLFNNFQWLGGDKDELGAVRLETTTLELEDLHLVVGVNGKTGEGIIQEARGLALIVRRPIRDLWHQLPAVEASVKIKDFRAALSDKEYQVITECAASNMAEVPNLPPPVVKSPPVDDKIKDQHEVDTVPETSNGEENGQDRPDSEAWTTIKVGIGIEMVALGLFTGQTRESALAEIQVAGVWASYKSNTLQESNIQATLEKFSVRDDREATQSEMRYMIGNSEEGNAGEPPHAAHEEKGGERPKKAIERQGSCSRPNCKPSLTMLVMDAKISPTLQMVSLRIQRPQLLVALDFLLAVAEFFVPSMHAMLSDGKGDGENPMEIQNAIFLRDSVHFQSSKEVILSPKTPLIADQDGIDTFIYDGKAGYIRLLDREGGDLRDYSKEVIILIGDGKKLIFKNVVIQNGDFLDSCIAMGSNSSYTVWENDGVFLEGQSEKPTEDFSPKATVEPASPPPDQDQAAKPPVELLFDLQAVSPELTFYDSMTKGSESELLGERLLRVRMNVFARVVLKGADMEVNAQVNSLGVETGGGVRVVEPVDMKLRYSNVSGKQNVGLESTAIFTNFSFSAIQLILRLQTDVMAFLRITSEQPTAECSQFDKIWQDDNESEGANCITFWRPRAPPGFAILGDCMTPRDELPSKGVIAVNMSLARVRKPVDLVCLWSSDQVLGDGFDDDNENRDVCSVWLPVPPPGYVALGCVAAPGKRRPPLNTCFCVMTPLVSRCTMSDCIIISGTKRPDDAHVPRWAFWRVDNSTGSFFLLSDGDDSAKCVPHELRQVISNYESFPVQETKPRIGRESPAEPQRAERALSTTRERILPSQGVVSGRFYENVARFDLVWWDKNSGSRKGVSIWRPVVPSGCVILGDIAVEGYEPPSMGLVLHDTEELGLLTKPIRYQERGQISPKRKMGGVSFWLPVAPSGYVPLGCIASTGSTAPEANDLVRCVRSDLVIGSNYSSSSLWQTSDIKYKKQQLGLWQVENEASTFIVGRGFKHPPTRLALSLADLKRPSAPENLTVNAKFNQISVTVSDDFGGLMAPLVDVSINDITVAVHGRMEAMSSTVNFSFQALNYNGNNNAWEPLIEPWDGLVRFEYSSDPADKTRPSEARIRLTASTALNINVSTANLNILLEAYASWNRINRMEENSKKQFSIDSKGRMSKPVISSKRRKALSCANHNELGEDLFLRITEKKHTKFLSLPSGGTVEVKLPSAQRMQLPGTSSLRRRTSDRTVAIRIGDAVVPVDEGIGGREFMATLRIIPLRETGDEQETQYQSARTRCVPPDDGAAETFTIHWDEVFIFEVDAEEETVAEIVVMDLGKGASMGSCKVALRKDSEISSEMGPGPRRGAHIPFNMLVLEWESLRRPESSEVPESPEKEPCGKVSFAMHFYSKASSLKSEAEHEHDMIQIGPTQHGPWSPMGLNYTLGSAPWTIHEDVVATEFYIEEGLKHVVMRSLVGVQNGTDFDLEVSLCISSALGKFSAAQESGNDVHVGDTVEDEYFENERYQPLAGWGSKWPGHFLPTDPSRYTTRELTNPSKEIPDVKLPLGWEWTSDWHVDKVCGGDENGWAYGFDFRSIEWPPSQNSEKIHSFVRRRRWIRSRKSVAKGGSRVKLGILASGSKLSLPAACLRRSSAIYCLQVRPTVASHGQPYEWSQVIPYKGFRAGRKQPVMKEISVRSLFETEQLLSCAVETSSGSSSTQAKDVWFCLEASSVVIGKDDQLDPVKEWTVTITASFMLKNYLPVPCEYSISEKTSGKRLVVRDRGVIKSGDAAGIFHIDLRKPTYLTWLPQGGWNPKKELVLISHPYKEPADHITYSNVRTSRSLEVMIEHDEEEKGVAAKVLQFYVPCWLDSEKCPPLQYRLMEILQRGDTKDDDDLPAKVHFEGVKLGNVTEEVNFEERNDFPTMLSDVDPKTMGLSVAINRGDRVHFGPVSPLLPLENPDGYMELRGLAESGSFFRFLVSAASCPLQFAKTKVIRIRPYILFTNRLGESLHLKQKDAEDSRTLGAADWRVSFSFPAADDPENLQIKVDGYEWSLPFSVEKEMSMVVPLRKSTGEQKFIKVDIRGYEEGSRFSILFRLGSARGPYKLENRTASSKLKFRQAGLDNDCWQLLKAHTTKTFAWDNPQGEQLLEVASAETNHAGMSQYEIDKVGDHPELRAESEPISVRVLELLEVKTIRFYSKHVEEDSSEDEEIESAGVDEGELVAAAREENMEEAPASSQVEVVVSVGKFGLSVTDQHPREILYLSLDNVVTTYQIGFGERTTRFKLRVGNMQLDNQLPLAWMPVLFAPERRDESKEFLVKVSIVMYDDKAEAREVYPYIGVQVESAFRINVHEPIIWAVVDMLNNVHFDRLSEGSAVVQADPEIRIELIDLSEVKLKLTLETAAGARPRGMLGIWSPLVTTLGNTNKMPIRIGSVLRHDRYMRKSAVSEAITNRIRRDLIHQPLQLLTGVDVLGMTSSTLGTLSQGAAELSKDEKYLRMRSSKDRSRNVAGLGDGLLQGTEALARGFGYGLTGVVTKPINSARQHGFIGFFQGVGKAAVGFVIIPVSGILDFVSLTVNGVGATCISCFELFEREHSLKRRRLPRAIRGNSVLCPYRPDEAAGQAILQLAQSTSFIGFKGVFTEQAKFAWSDFYEAHFELPKNKFLMLTNRRILLLGRPKSHMQNPAKTFSDPSTILWEVTWRNLLALEIKALESSLILHLRNSNVTFAQAVKCHVGNVEGGSSNAHLAFRALQRVWKEYGPDRTTILSEIAKKGKHQSGRLTLRPRSKRTESVPDEGLEERMSTESSSSRDSASSFTNEVVLFEQIWSSERDASGSCCSPIISSQLCTIWRPNAAEGYVSVGDIARIGSDPPPVSVTYRNENGDFALPLSYALLWRNWKDGFCAPVSIWLPKPPEGYVTVGCVAVADYVEPAPDAVWCVREDLTETATLEASDVWHATAPWHCYIFPLACESLSFVASRQQKHDSTRRLRKVKLPDASQQQT